MGCDGSTLGCQPRGEGSIPPYILSKTFCAGPTYCAKPPKQKDL